MAFTTKQTTQLNKMNRASQNVGLGTILANLNASGSIVIGTHTVTEAESNASRIVLTTGLASVTTFWESYKRSGSPLSLTWTSGSVAGTITVASGASASPVKNTDVASYIALQ
jgi:fluoride ion exporter CrcB/FEX